MRTTVVNNFTAKYLTDCPPQKISEITFLFLESSPDCEMVCTVTQLQLQ